ncbi:MAG: hypothetical protein IJL63_07880 [Clostridia bacterium]|nr:hypothetical protein [Clostridia bacterium]
MFEAILEAVIYVLFDSADETLSNDNASKTKKMLAAVVILTVLLITVLFLAFVVITVFSKNPLLAVGLCILFLGLIVLMLYSVIKKIKKK